ncbi:MAG: tetratricopeptide repeat protein [Acetobacter sp.]|nr:tetratricopeptide repeat protein [Acetobacter sp.]
MCGYRFYWLRGGRYYGVIASIITLMLAGCANQNNVEKKDLLTARIEMDHGASMPALRLLRRYVSNHPEDVPTLLALARANAQLRRYQPAVLLYQDVLRQDPSNVEAHKGLARVMLHTNPQEAVKELKELSVQASRDPKVWVDLGIAYDTVGDHQSAQAAYYQAMKLDPLLLSAQVNLALSYALSGRYDLAYDTLEPLARSGDATPKISADFAYIRKMLAQQHGVAFPNTPSNISSDIPSNMSLESASPTSQPEFSEDMYSTQMTSRRRRAQRLLQKYFRPSKNQIVINDGGGNAQPLQTVQPSQISLQSSPRGPVQEETLARVPSPQQTQQPASSHIDSMPPSMLETSGGFGNSGESFTAQPVPIKPDSIKTDAIKPVSIQSEPISSTPITPVPITPTPITKSEAQQGQSTERQPPLATEIPLSASSQQLSQHSLPMGAQTAASQAEQNSQTSQNVQSSQNSSPQMFDGQEITTIRIDHSYVPPKR